ncbi:hypothetical protein HELRODRAFT_164141 [Helobdella robusta]|uniref:Uncharacterized protein n=1 Tax=Helobdella robusta TaxID=6412 RepID=T1EUZ7_HELRO|nr:hypothetical protein HELRODRAFT_164141 [Helobdella robusta]ESN94320.1 hypothetical protein HELRODRAFT_164141 [Helobdella robusta]
MEHDFEMLFYNAKVTLELIGAVIITQLFEKSGLKKIKREVTPKRLSYVSLSQNDEIKVKKRVCTVSGCIKAKSGEIILEKEKVLERWTEYINDLSDDICGEMPFIKKDVEGPKILRSEVRIPLSKMKSNKALSPEEIVVKEIKYL